MKRSTTFGRIYTWIRQLEFVTSTQFLSESYFSKKNWAIRCACAYCTQIKLCYRSGTLEKEERIRQITGLGSLLLFPKYVRLLLDIIIGFEHIISNYFIGYLDSNETDEKDKLWILIYNLNWCMYIIQYKYKYFLFRFQAGDVWYNVQVWYLICVLVPEPYRVINWWSKNYVQFLIHTGW